MTRMLDGDLGWRDYTGAVRVRDAGTGQLQIQVSTGDDANGYDVSTFVVPGSLRDTRYSATQWPTYAPANSFTPETQTDRLNAAGLARAQVPTDANAAPISASTNKAQI